MRLKRLLTLLFPHRLMLKPYLWNEVVRGYDDPAFPFTIVFNQLRRSVMSIRYTELLGVEDVTGTTLKTHLSKC